MIPTLFSQQVVANQFPLVYTCKKAIVVSPRINLMYYHVTNFLEKKIKSTLLGSAKLDEIVEDRALSTNCEDSIIFVTPEWISEPEK